MQQGTLDLLVLQVAAHGPIHGYGIAQRIKQISRDVLHVPQDRCIPRSTAWRTAKLLVAEWKPSDTGRDAKFYRLTPKGRAQLQEQTESWARLAEAVGLILGAAGGDTR